VPRREKYVPRHRNATAEPALKKSLRKSVTYSGVAVAATGIAVTSGVFLRDGASDPATTATAAIASGSAHHDAADGQPAQPAPVGAGDDVSGGDPAAGDADRTVALSRSADRAALDESKQSLLDPKSGGQVTRTEDLTDQDPRDIARALLPEYGFSEADFGCLDSLYMSESGWDMHADNPTSSAYGIPQALTGGTHDLPADYMTNPVSQIRWGLDYIRSSYGTPCNAWSFKQSHNWY
jgi:hypothetical protein